MGSPSLTPLTFTGLSQFAGDFQQIVNRAVAIAQLPITALQNHQSDLANEEQLATGLQTAVATLATTVTNLGNLGTNQGMTGSSSDTTKVVVNNTSGTTPASYAITNITSVASATSASTVSGYADATTAAVSTSGTMQLKINGVAVTPNIDLTGAGTNNLNGLAAAINNLNAGVTASVISTGTGATPYYLSISANSTGQTPSHWSRIRTAPIRQSRSTAPQARMQISMSTAHTSPAPPIPSATSFRE